MKITGSFKFQKITIFGVGLIGGSFALAMKKKKLCGHIVGFGRSEKNLKRAKNKKIIDSYKLNPVAACKDSDLILFATPVGFFIDLAEIIKDSIKSGAIVTDVGSVKGKLVYDIEKILPETVYFVGGHPIAGSDQSGIDAASANIFKSAKCMITPTDKTDKNAMNSVISIWETFGSIVKIIDPYEHDRIYGAISHLPHVIAYNLVNTVAEIDSSYLLFSGQGFKDTTRIASSHQELWRDICLLNRENLLKYIEVFIKNLDRVKKHLKASDAKSIERDFANARELREGIG